MRLFIYRRSFGLPECLVWQTREQFRTSMGPDLLYGSHWRTNTFPLTPFIEAKHVIQHEISCNEMMVHLFVAVSHRKRRVEQLKKSQTLREHLRARKAALCLYFGSSIMLVTYFVNFR